MNRLPPELLGMIADSIQQDPQTLRGQQTLSALASANKTFYSICNPKLYQHPICRDTRAAARWSMFYASKINPWTINQKFRGFENDVLPRSVDNAGAKKNASSPNGDSGRPTQPAVELRITKLAVAPALFHNLTSFSVSPDFDTDHAVTLDFLAALFGPIGSNRRKMIHLRLPLKRAWPFLPFLLESVKRMKWHFEDDSFEDVLGDIVEAHPDEKTKSVIRQRLEEEGDAGLDWDEFFELQKTALELALVRYSVFKVMEPETEDPVILLPICIRSRNIDCHPFTSLVKLSIAALETFELYLVFHSHLFPSLVYLKISRGIDASNNLEYDVKLLRHSITKRNGTIFQPCWGSDVGLAFEEELWDWTPLTKEEIEAEPKISYIGPNLDELDLSELWIRMMVE
ncbi:hypothetical protein JCM3765_001496 [Sporobolomyces pararoseus]